MAQRILITGANRGIGLEMTTQALTRGDTVIAACRTPENAAALDDLAAAHGEALTIIRIEAREEASVQAAAAIAGPIDLLVANAGTMNARGGLTDAGHTQDNIADSLMTNIAGVFFTARHFLANLKDGAADRDASIIPRIAVMSSQMGSSERAGTSAPIYRATKAAATNLARSMALELAEDGLAVGAYHPGWVQTDMGGANATITAGPSAAGLLQRFDALSMATSGVFETYEGEPLPF